jgi:hypothetical protein
LQISLRESRNSGFHDENKIVGFSFGGKCCLCQCFCLSARYNHERPHEALRKIPVVAFRTQQYPNPLLLTDTEWQWAAESLEDAIKRADSLLYLAKQNGHNQIMPDL